MTARKNTVAASSPGWWREPMMWLVVGGPLVVVVASFITLTLAVRYPDQVLTGAQAAAASEQAADLRTGPEGNANIPALQARNHAATGGR